MAVGIKPNAEIAAAAGLAVNRGIIVNDHLSTNTAGIFAIGECAEHRGVCYGLVEPANEQAHVLAERLAGRDVRYDGSVNATNLKVSGVHVFSAGDFLGAAGTESIVLSDPGLGTYRKLVVAGGRMVGAVFYGDTADCALVSRTHSHRCRDRILPRGSDLRPGAGRAASGVRTCRASRQSNRNVRPCLSMNALPPHPPAVRTTCPYCGVGCGVLAAPDGHGGAAISGDPAHPANFGRLCSKGCALGETLSLDRRLLHPMLRQPDGSLVRADWDRRSKKLRSGLRAIIERDGPGAVAFYLSGQLLTEDYYVANKLMKGFFGSSNVDTNSRLCMASSVAGHRRAFGADIVPGTYRDIDEADLIVLVGSNAAWCHPVLYQRMVAAKRERGTKLVVIDPRRTATAEAAICFCRSRPAWIPRCSAACSRISPTRWRSIYGYIERIRRALSRRSRARAKLPRDAAATARATGLDPGRHRAFLRAVPQHRARRHLLLAGRQSIGARHRQGQRHHQRSPRDRPHRPARHGAVLAHRPAQRHGRARGRRARQSARRPYGFFAARARIACAASGMRRAWRRARGSKPSICSKPSSAERSRRCG